MSIPIVEIGEEQCPKCSGIVTGSNVIVDMVLGIVKCPHCGYIIDQWDTFEDEDE